MRSHILCDVVSIMLAYAAWCMCLHMSVLRDVVLQCLSACTCTEADHIAKQKKGNEFTCKFCRVSSWCKKWARNGGRVRPPLLFCVLRDKQKQNK